MNARYNLRAGLLALAALICLPFAGPGAAQAAENKSPAWGLSNLIGSFNPYDALWLVMDDPNVHQNLLYVTMDMRYNLPTYGEWESVTWRPASTFPTQRFPASLLGTDWSTTPIEGRYIELRNLTLDRADLNAQNVEFRFSPLPPVPGTTTSLTLNNGSLTALNPPGFYADANFTLTALGDSTLSDWGKGPVSSQTTLNVTPGSTLTFFRLGTFQGGTIATDSWYFNHPGNVATIDAGTLHLDQSFVTFGKSTYIPGEEPGRMTFQNNALLDITGEGGRLDSGHFFFLNSRLNLGSANRLKAVARVTVNGATLTTDEDSQLVTSALDVFGTNTFALGKESSAGNYIATTGEMVMEPGASLTLNGQGSLAVTFGLDYGFPASGQIVINDRATLVNAGARFDIPPSAPITINRNPASPDAFGFLEVKDGGNLYLRAAAADTGHVTNHGGIGVSANGALIPLGPVVIQGGSEGYIAINDEGVLSIGNQGTPLAATDSLTTNNQVLLDNFSKLELTLDPTARKIGQLRTGSTLTLTGLGELHLSLVNDTALPDGAKFTLIDYGKLDGDPVPGFAYFKGYPNGSTFVLGLNHYRINYADTPDPGYNGAITLTVVPAVPPASLSPAVQTVAGTVGAPLTQTAAMIPSGFGGTVTYTISPGLPNGLTFNNATGAIFGTPTAALTTTAFTIRAAGSVSGTATATVNLTIGVASQTISFGPTPTPTYAPGGGFQVFASATSGLPVTYSSLTPAICDAHGSTILMLGAGTCTIAADQPGNTNYTAAPQATQSITIAKAQPRPLTLSANPSTINVSETSALTVSGGGGTGTINYFVTSGACSVTGTGPSASLTSATAGSCTVEARQAGDGNYLGGTSNPVIIQVGTGAQLPLVLTANPTSLDVNSISQLSTSGGSGDGVVTYAVTSGACTVNGSGPTATVTAAAQGQCQITATKPGNKDYGPATSNPVTVTFNRLAPPALVLTASPVSIGFNGSSTLGTTGGIPGAPVSYSVSGPCSVSGNTLLGVSAGLCTVTASQAETAVYSAVTSNPVTITVKERTTTFSYPQGTATIGQPFSLTPVTSGFTKPTFALLYGNLPAGLTLNPTTGVISGTPTGPIGTVDGVISSYENNAYDAALAVIGVGNDPQAIPTLGEWGMLILMLLMVLTAGWRGRKAGLR